MSGPSDKILTSAGIIKERDPFVDSFLDSVSRGMKSGNSFGPDIFHFDPLSPVLADLTILSLKEKGDTYKTIFVDSLCLMPAKALDINGQTPIPAPIPGVPLFDVTSIVEQKIPLLQVRNPTDLPLWFIGNLIGEANKELVAAKIANPAELPQITQRVNDAIGRINPAPQLIPIPKIPQIPSISIPQLPGYEHLLRQEIPQQNIDPKNFILPEISTGFLSATIAIMTSILTDINKMISLIVGFKDFPKMIIDLFFMAISQIPPLIKVFSQEKKPPLFVATVLEVIKFLCGAVGALIVGSILGAGGISASVPQLVSTFF
jgi:hypothetical protein